ncbi:hypothetical protein L210DRAFT_933845 [Boletus edulis BED1]|uniref:Uncharacterized protein n=1 Tax=Boletus edulis BED1 TaxID=1328754 RepID=A0AAD4BJB2_BOLED|nr:hypothetical protein L210DRAFT_933845 [Boletus edulis BED1]
MCTTTPSYISDMPQLDSPINNDAAIPNSESDAFSPGPFSNPQSPHKINEWMSGFAVPRWRPIAGILPEKPTILQRSALSPSSSLEAARSNHVISALKKDIAFEMVYHNTVALQLNRVMLEKAQEDLSNADEHVGYV